MAVLAEIRRIASTTTPRWPSAYPLDPHLGSRLPTFHDKPKLFGGPLSEGKDVRDGAHGVWHE